MKINLAPSRRDDSLVVEKTGDKLRINGDLFSFVSLPEGATIKAADIPCEWIVGDVTRTGGEIELSLLLPHGANPSAAVAFPERLEDVPDGVVYLPSDPKQSVPLIPRTEVANVDA